MKNTKPTILELCNICKVIGVISELVVSYKNAIKIPNTIIGRKLAILVCNILNKALLNNTPAITPKRFLIALYKNPLKNISSMIGPKIETNIVKKNTTLPLLSSRNMSNTGCVGAS